VCLANINTDKFNVIAIFFLQGLKSPELGSIRPSREAAKDQGNRLFPTIIAQRD
jgi:hypothetical protein